MKSLLLVITLFFSTFLSAQKTSNLDVEKKRITANIYAILIDGKNDFENFKGDFVSKDNKGNDLYRVKNQNGAEKNFFTSEIKVDKSLSYTGLVFESDDERGELFFRTIEQVFEDLVNQKILIKKTISFPAGIETKAATYFDNSYGPVAYNWYKSTNPKLRYSIYICPNNNVNNWVQSYVTANKISVPKPINPISKTTSKPVKKESSVAHQDLKKYVLESSSVENSKTPETKPQFPTSHLKPNYIADQIDSSSLEGKDAVRSQNGYDAYSDLRFEAMNLNWGSGNTKEVNPEKAFALSNEVIRIFPNLHRAYIDRGQANYKLGNKIAAQNDFDKAKQLAPFESKWIDKAIADVEGRKWVDPDRVTTTYEYTAPTVLYNSANTPPVNNEVLLTCSKCSGSGKKANPNWGKSSNYYIVNGLGQTQERSDYRTHIECDACGGTGKIKY